ncbi:MAG TPA: MaoC family dehydratase [Thermomicrobiaceae bacterium]|nr:MaoC family dehydratase [Thermomicrobiaceae bacterium]
MSSSSAEGAAALQGRVVRSVPELKEYIGQEISIGPWVEITQEMVDRFADATGDHQFIHVDPERARETFFGGTIAHGFLTLSIGSILGRGRQGLEIDLGGRMAVNYGTNRVRFPAPVRVGKRIRMHSRLLAVDEIGDRAVQITREQTIEIEGEDKPACVAETLGRTYF